MSPTPALIIVGFAIPHLKDIITVEVGAILELAMEHLVDFGLLGTNLSIQNHDDTAI